MPLEFPIAIDVDSSDDVDGIPYILTTSGLTTGRQFRGRQSWVMF